MTKKKALILTGLKYTFALALMFCVVNWGLFLSGVNPLLANSKFPLMPIAFLLCFVGLDFELKNYVYGGKLPIIKTFIVNFACAMVLACCCIGFQLGLIYSTPALFQEFRQISSDLVSQMDSNAIKTLGETSSAMEATREVIAQQTIRTWLLSEASKALIFGFALASVVLLIFSKRKVVLKHGDGKGK